MSRNEPFSRAERGVVLYGILGFVLGLVVLQIWLLSATMNAYLGGDESVVWPAALASVVLFGLNAGLMYFVGRLARP